MSATTTAAGPLITVPYDDCTLDTCPIIAAQLPYDPNLAGNLLYLVMFALCLLINLALGFWYRTWGYLVAMSFACLLEILGYVGRIQMHYNPFPHNPFLIYLICVTLASVFFTAAIYLCLSRIVVVYGKHLSYFQPRTYTLLFIICDFVSLLLQAVGGAMVSLADDYDFEQEGLHVMQSGLIFQVASLLVFVALCALFAWTCRQKSTVLDQRFAELRSLPRFHFFLWSLSLATLTMLIRCTFRIAELSQGFQGHIWVDEVDYMVLEGAMISICVILLTVGHPGFIFGEHYKATDFKVRVKSSEESNDSNQDA